MHHHYCQQIIKMKNLYQNKYRNESHRAQWWDYTKNAAYYVTIVTKDREHFFGEIENGEMNLSEIGKIANDLWYEIPQHQPNVKLDEFVVMPNHIHCIVVIDKPDGDANHDIVVDVGAMHASPLPPTQSPPTPKNQKMADISPKPGSLAVIIGGYKSAITRNARKIDPQYDWQSRFYDHIIRDEKSLNRIRDYIKNNPKNWNNDKMKFK